jgi:hypothetical protein
MKGAGGGKRKGRRPTRVDSNDARRIDSNDARRIDPDDRPRGYEAQRMRQLWRDIEQAKHKAGLGPEPTAAPPPWWDLGAVLALASALAGEAAAWVSATAPTACSLVATGAAVLRQVPVVGRLAELVPVPAPTPPAPRNARRPGDATVAVEVPVGAPNGHQME